MDKKQIEPYVGDRIRVVTKFGDVFEGKLVHVGEQTSIDVSGDGGLAKPWTEDIVKLEHISLGNNQERMHKNQDKENCYIGVGDIVQVMAKDDGMTVLCEGPIVNIGLRIQKNTAYEGIHPFIDIKMPNGDEKMFWTENIRLKVVSFKGEGAD